MVACLNRLLRTRFTAVSCRLSSWALSTYLINRWNELGARSAKVGGVVEADLPASTGLTSWPSCNVEVINGALDCAVEVAELPLGQQNLRTRVSKCLGRRSEYRSEVTDRGISGVIGVVGVIATASVPTTESPAKR